MKNRSKSTNNKKNPEVMGERTKTRDRFWRRMTNQKGMAHSLLSFLFQLWHIDFVRKSLMKE